MTETITGIDIPDTELAREATELVGKAEITLLFDHSRPVSHFASLKGRYRKIEARPERLYVGAMFHDLGLTERPVPPPFVIFTRPTSIRRVQ
jgi:hypothetical protein